MPRQPLTAEELDAIPEQETHKTLVDDQGHSYRVRVTQRWLLWRDDGIFTYRDRTGQRWFVGEDIDGTLYKERRDF